MININVISAVLSYDDLGPVISNLKKDKSPKACYVTFSKTSSFLMQRLNEAKISTKDIFFIDMITTSLSSFTSPPDEKNRAFLTTDADLFTLYEQIERVIKKHPGSKLILDSLSSLAVYQKEKDIFSFIKRLTVMLNDYKHDGVFLVLSQDFDSDFIRSLLPMMDRVEKS